MKLNIGSWRRAVGLTLVGTVLFACGGGGGGGATTAPTDDPGAPVEVTVRASEFAYNPSNIQVPADTPVTLVLINEGVVEHDLTIETEGVTLLAQPGETVMETLTLPAGTYHVHCTIPGHRDAGMEANLTAG